MTRKEKTASVKFIERWETGWETRDMTRVGISTVGLFSVSTRGNRLGQVGLITGFPVADGRQSRSIGGYFVDTDIFRGGGSGYFVSFATAFEETVDDKRNYRQDQSKRQPPEDG